MVQSLSIICIHLHVAETNECLTGKKLSWIIKSMSDESNATAARYHHRLQLSMSAKMIMRTIARHTYERILNSICTTYLLLQILCRTSFLHLLPSYNKQTTIIPKISCHVFLRRLSSKVYKLGFFIFLNSSHVC